MKPIYLVTLIAGLELAVTHALSEFFHLYWRYSWLDIPMHILGGLFVVLILLTFKEMQLRILKKASPFLLGSIMMVALIIWEMFGIFRYGGIKPDFFTDTSLDIVCGVVGIVLGILLARMLHKLT